MSVPTQPTQDNHLIDLRPSQLGALAGVMLLAFAAPLAMAFNIEAIANAFGASNTKAGSIATVEMLAISISSLVAAQLAPRLPLQRGILLGLGVACAANLGTVWVSSLPVMAALRACAGVGCGLVIALIMSVAGRTRNPEMTFGVVNSAVGFMGMAISQVLPRVIAAQGLAGAYGFYVLCCLLALPLIRFLPVPASREDLRRGGDGGGSQLGGWVALFGLGLVFLGHTALILFVVRIGTAVPLSLQTVGNVFLVGSFFAALGPLISGFLGSRLTSTLPAGLILLALVASAYLLANAGTPRAYYLAAPLFASLPLVLMPIVLGAFALVDPSGRLTGAHPAFITMGAAIAPFFGGLTSDLGGYTTTGWFTIMCVMTGAALLFSTARRADEVRRHRALSADDPLRSPVTPT